MIQLYWRCTLYYIIIIWLYYYYLLLILLLLFIKSTSILLNNINIIRIITIQYVTIRNSNHIVLPGESNYKTTTITTFHYYHFITIFFILLLSLLIISNIILLNNIIIIRIITIHYIAIRNINNIVLQGGRIVWYNYINGTYNIYTIHANILTNNIINNTLLPTFDFVFTINILFQFAIVHHV